MPHSKHLRLEYTCYINLQVRLGVDIGLLVEFPGTLRDDKLEIPNIPGEHHYSALGL